MYRNMLSFTAECEEHKKALKIKTQVADISESNLRVCSEIFDGETAVFEMHWSAFKCPFGEQTCRDQWVLGQVNE